MGMKEIKAISDTEFEGHFIIVFSTDLTAEESRYVEQIIGWLAKVKLRMQEDTSFEWYGDDILMVSMDTTKSASDDVLAREWEFFDGLEDYIKNGSDIRTTNKAGKGTKGTRLVNPPTLLPFHIKEVWGDMVWYEEGRHMEYLTTDDMVELITAYRNSNVPQTKPEPVAYSSGGITVSVTVTTRKSTKVTITIE